MVAGGELLSAGVLAVAPRLRFIARTVVDYDSVDVAAATIRKVVVTITPGRIMTAWPNIPSHRSWP